MSEMEVPEGWKLEKIGELAQVIRGSSPRPKGDYRYFDGPIPWIKISDITASPGKYIYHTREGLTKEGVLKSRFLKSGTLILTTSMLIAMPKILKMDGCIHDGFLAILNLNNKVDLNYLYYYFLAYRSKIEKDNSLGTAIKNINTEVVKNLQLPFPSILLQKQIVKKIENVLAKLEVKKKEIFSLIEQNKERVKFFEKNWVTFLIDNEIKNHPQSNEWEFTKLGDVGEYKYGYNGKATSDNSGTPYLRITDINFDGSLKPKRMFVDISDNDFKLYGLKNNDIVIARTGATVGKSFLFNEDRDFVFASYLIRYRFDTKKIFPNFLYYVLQSHSFWKYIGISQNVGAQPNVNATKMSNFIFNLPPIDIQKQIVKNIKNAEEKFKSQKTQFENIKENYESRIKYINHIQSSILDIAFSGKLIN